MNIQEILGLLRTRGVDRIFGVPGSGRSLDLLLAATEEGLTFTSTQSESAAALAAGSYARLMNSIGVAITIRGPGLANALGGIVTAGLEQMPLLVVSESHDNAASTHKKIDQDQLVRSVTKATCSLGGGIEDLASCLECALAPPQGPVLLQLRQESGVRQSAESPIQTRFSQNHEQLISRANRPVLILGAGAAGQAILPAIGRLTLPVFTSVAGKGLVDESLPPSAGVFNGVGGPPTNEHLVNQSDLQITIGLSDAELVVSNLAASLNLTSVQTGWGEDIHFSDAERVVTLLSGKRWQPALQRVREDERFSPLAIVDILNSLDTPFRLVTDTGLFSLAFERGFKTSTHGRFLGAPNSRSMGAAIPVAIGAALADRTMPNILVVGDGGIGMYFGELTLAIQEQLQLLILHVDSSNLASIKGNRHHAGIEEITQKHFPSTSWLSSLNHAWVVHSASETRTALNNWLEDDQKSVGLIRAVFDPDEYIDCLRHLENA